MYVKVHSLASRNKIALFGVVLSLDQAITKKKTQEPLRYLSNTILRLHCVSKSIDHMFHGFIGSRVPQSIGTLRHLKFTYLSTSTMFFRNAFVVTDYNKLRQQLVQPNQSVNWYGFFHQKPPKTCWCSITSTRHWSSSRSADMWHKCKTHGTMWECGLTSLVICINGKNQWYKEKKCDKEEWDLN